jgi:quercetin dioxygenase-like cupin family protein
MYQLTRRLFLGACALMAFTALPILAAPSSAAEPKYWRDGKMVPAVPVAEWEADGKPMKATGKDAVAKAPKNAVKYAVKTVKWPTGTIRVYNFTKDGGGVLHNITDETQFIVIKGSLKATVGSKTELLKAFDVASRASGMLKSGDVVEDTSIVTWDVGPVSTDTPTPTVVHPQDAKASGTGTNGSTMIRVYPFPGNSVRYAEAPGNWKSGPPNTGPADNYMYFIEGHVQYSQGGETYEVHGGDFLVQASGVPHTWDYKDGAHFVASSAVPLGKKAMDPTQAFTSYKKQLEEPKK